ncbi:ABC transporter permease, partial [Paenibacillus sp. TRM 82003]|uniref:ABC transporter permease n=1 Tax=Kineococcus sp. TRM81007 TaxID=2925831 RepID=UPI001F580F7A|nr:ABC transporter permease [Kineococcus sp. TRM81007]MCI2239428.1 ABC transporter permease [Kineococcus sp. TRM81007]MCI3918798.1 ABC transporter permease [Paenibacillus sp. TRM 82003]
MNPPAGATASLALAVVLLAALAVAAGRVGGLRQGREVAVVCARATVQIAAIGLVLGAVLRTPALAPLYLALALAVASWTSARRLGSLRTWPGTALAVGAGALPAASVVVATGALPLRALDVVPFTAQLIGGAMGATTLAGRRMLDDVTERWDLVEGWLALGAAPARAVAELGRTAAARALAPALDQTRNVGLVTLPGAFVGLLLGGASPLEAARVQLLVLVGLIAAETIAVVVITRLLGRGVRTRPAPASTPR